MWTKPTQLIGIASLLFLAAVGIAVPTVAAQEGATMPDIVGMTLDAAREAVVEASGNPELVLNSQNVAGPNQEHLAEKFWKVCWQSPKADAPMTGVEWFGVGVVRAGEPCWD